MSNKFPKFILTNDIIENQVQYDLIDYQKKIKKAITWPIDMDSFLENLWGLSISYEDDLVCPDTNDKVVGCLSVARKEVKVNLLENNSEGRINFTLSHEGGHASLHSSLSKSLSTNEIIDTIYCRSKYPTIAPLIERQANWYAVNLLMPKRILFEKFQNSEEVDMNTVASELMQLFGVSRYALELRLFKLGFKLRNNMHHF